MRSIMAPPSAAAALRVLRSHFAMAAARGGGRALLVGDRLLFAQPLAQAFARIAVDAAVFLAALERAVARRLLVRRGYRLRDRRGGEANEQQAFQEVLHERH